MRRAISFVGTGNYQDATYFFGNRECRTNLFPEVVYEIFRPDELIIFLTADAEKKHLCTLNERLAGKKWRPVFIPDGKNEAEIWEIFEIITQNVKKGDKLIFDITHAFRSIPMVVMISITYMKAAMGVELEAVVYGAWEARSSMGEGDRAPVFDLTPFMNLLDWTNATEMFIKTGHGGEIARLLRNAHQVAYKRIQAESKSPPKELKNVANDIEKISQALALARSREVMKHAQRLSERPERYKTEAEEWAKPFSLLIDRIAESFLPFAAEDGSGIEEKLGTEYKIIEWLINKNQIAQAILLSREWIVTYLIHKLCEDDKVYDDEFRREIEQKINSSIHGENILPVERRLLEIWAELGDLRNDTAHCGMRRNPRPSDNIINRAKAICKELCKFTQL